MEQTKVDVVIPGDAPRPYKVEESLIDVNNPNYSRMNVNKESSVPVINVLDADRVKIGTT